MVRKSPVNPSNQVLGVLSLEEAQTFVLECANLPDPIGMPKYLRHFDRWLRHWQHFFTFQTEGNDGIYRNQNIDKEKLVHFVPKVQQALWRIWREPDSRQRDWYLFRLRDDYHRMTIRAANPNLFDPTAPNAVNDLKHMERVSRDRGDNSYQRTRFLETQMGSDLFQYVPKLCPFEAALYWLQVNQRLMLCCPGPNCAAPYFFRSAKGQKFCSPECADPSRREAKLRWWNESANSPKNRR
jgi:hypothetical protein